MEKLSYGNTYVMLVVLVRESEGCVWDYLGSLPSPGVELGAGPVGRVEALGEPLPVRVQCRMFTDVSHVNIQSSIHIKLLQKSI